MNRRVQTTIEEKITRRLDPAYLEVTNESHRHNVAPGSESHFKVVVVSRSFENRRLLERHRALNELLAEELAGGVHALALHTLTPAEWKQRHGEIPASPPCRGGGGDVRGNE